MNQSVSSIARGRGVTEIVHFTTDLGLLGAITVGGLLSRKRLPEEEWLEHIFKVNAERRWDHHWLDFVNLSVSQINHVFFGAAKSWHSSEHGQWWCILSFEPEILDHDGVVFSTTNNAYPATTRASGATGFKALFSDVVLGRYNHPSTRAGLSDSQTTDAQAEVLYPESLSLEFLRQAYFLDEDHVHYYESLAEERKRPDLQGKALVAQDAFRGRG